MEVRLAPIPNLRPVHGNYPTEEPMPTLMTTAQSIATRKLAGLAFAEGIKHDPPTSLDDTVVGKKWAEIWSAVHDAVAALPEEADRQAMEDAADEAWSRLLRTN